MPTTGFLPKPALVSMIVCAGNKEGSFTCRPLTIPGLHEPAASAVTGQRSNQLTASPLASHARKNNCRKIAIDAGLNALEYCRL
jgi:hypothetical protein